MTQPNNHSSRLALLAALVLVAIGGVVTWYLRTPPAPAAATRSSAAAPVASKLLMPFADASAIIEAHRSELPSELAQAAPADLPDAWPRWLARQDAEIRKRLQRGDEDSLVYLWLFGTTFTSHPRVTKYDIQQLADSKRAVDVIVGRLDDLIAAIAAPSPNERLRYARQVFDSKGISLDTDEGRARARDELIEARERVMAENDAYRRVLMAAQTLQDPDAQIKASGSLFHERGLSSDTSILVDLTVDHSLQSAAAAGQLKPGSVRRVAIVGPGLDYTDKAEGHDFYPLQTIQPFALIDSLIRLGLAKADDLHVATFDLSPRVNQHLQSARTRAAAGESYVLQVVLDAETPFRQWSSQVTQYWQRMGLALGEEATPIPAPVTAGPVRVRSVRIRPEVVLSITPHDLNIVVERMNPAGAEGFDLVLATNILVYYSAFEQELALANIAAMLQPNGFLLANYAVAQSGRIERVPNLTTKVAWDQNGNGDTLLWYKVK